MIIRTTLEGDLIRAEVGKLVWRNNRSEKWWRLGCRRQNEKVVRLRIHLMAMLIGFAGKAAKDDLA